MTSLFESAESNDVSVDLMSRGGQGVALLEFMSVGSHGVDDTEAPSDDRVHLEDEEQVRSMRARAMLDAAREEAVADTRRVLGEEYESRVQRERRRVEGLLLEFAEQRQLYFVQAEAAVVRLSLTVAAKILQREVAVDEMLLTATVKAALSRIHDGSIVVVRVRPEEVGVWEQVFAEENGNRIEVEGDRTLRAGDCVMETTIGTVELGVVAQLGEIERGFRELLERSSG